ncbi:RNA recognition motif domain-containing protein [Gallaecimonas sp. GXIMD1310]|uniref:RNA recognition motif domain-containing protein n=1 Tax=Gallaecimonas sp. GXIMD1310 TaxID=3131926 RepID=UPI003252CBAA
MNKNHLLIILALAVLGYFLPILISTSALNASLWCAVGVVIGGLAIAFSPSATAKQATRSDDIATITLYVGNLPYRANEQSVQQAFEQYGKVLSVRLLKDRNTGRRRGFGFVEMLKEDAAAAIRGLNDQPFQERTLKVREAKERQDD